MVCSRIASDWSPAAAAGSRRPSKIAYQNDQSLATKVLSEIVVSLPRTLFGEAYDRTWPARSALLQRLQSIGNCEFFVVKYFPFKLTRLGRLQRCACTCVIHTVYAMDSLSKSK